MDSSPKKRAVEILRKTRAKTQFKRPGVVGKKQANRVAREKARKAARNALNAMQQTVNMDDQRKAMRELQALIGGGNGGKRPRSRSRSAGNTAVRRKRPRTNNNNNRRATAIEKIKGVRARARATRRRLNAAGRDYPYRTANVASNVNVFRNQSGIVRVRRSADVQHGTKARWKHKLKPKPKPKNVRAAGGMKEYLTAKHGDKDWHRYRPRGRYESTTRCEYIAPKKALVKLAETRGIRVNAKKDTKAKICDRLSPLGRLNN